MIRRIFLSLARYFRRKKYLRVNARPVNDPRCSISQFKRVMSENKRYG